MATDQTRRRILDAAETLFAKQGFEATSVRMVVAEASVNLAAVHYHFGSKGALVRAVFERRIGPLNAERMRRLDRLIELRADAPLTLEAVLDTLIRPAVELQVGRECDSPSLTTLIGRAHLEPDRALGAVLREQFDAVRERYLTVLAESLVHLSEEERAARFQLVVATMASALADPARFVSPAHREVDGTGAALLTARLVAFLAAALRAPAVSAAPTEQCSTSREVSP